MLQVKHFKIEGDAGKFYLALRVPDGRTFPTIPAMIETYCSGIEVSDTKLIEGLQRKMPSTSAPPPSQVGPPVQVYRAPAQPAPAMAPVRHGNAATSAGIMCSSCPMTLLPGERFCGGCGKPATGATLVGTAAAKPSTTQSCPKCSSQVPPGSKFCEFCGAKV